MTITMSGLCTTLNFKAFAKNSFLNNYLFDTQCLTRGRNNVKRLARFKGLKGELVLKVLKVNSF